MSEASPQPPTDLAHAFREYERGVRIHNYRVACVLALIFMPAGCVLDMLVYHEQWLFFLKLRLCCSALLLFIWWFVRTPPGLKSLWVLGQILPALPSFFISWMVYRTTGALSPYYAGINVVLLGAALILRWTLFDSVLVVATAIGMYLAACALHGPVSFRGTFFNNIYFLFVTGVFVIIGNLFYNRIRFREFELRYELDKSRSMLAENNEKLKELDQVKNRFFANISHELRTPLTLLLSPLETMLHGQGRKFDTETRNLMNIMHGNGMRLLKLINDLLDLVRLESGRMEVKREPLEMASFIKGLMGGPQQMADNKGLRLESWVTPELGAVLLDRDKLEKTILNLVFNALKFTPANGLVALRVEKKDDQLVTTVRDTGVGISSKNLPFVFDRFWQADNSSKRKYQGVGIGLSLVKELTEVQGGKVSVESEEGKGTMFTVSLPFLRAEAGVIPKPEEQLVAPEAPAGKPGTANGTQSEEWLGNLYRRAALFPAVSPLPDTEQLANNATNGTHPTLLVADDEPDMLRFLKSQLTSHYHVVEAVDGQQAFDKAGQTLPDIILLDMNMPEKDGLQVCRELREQESTRDIPIIILTARADEQTKLAALSAGANDFLSKPFSTSELHVRVKNLVVSHHYQEKLAKQNQVLETTIDQLKETETLLVQTEKMVSLGRMSAGIIHEINNPLNYATTGLYTLRNKAKHVAPEQQAEYQEVLADVEEGIKRVKSIVSDLKTFTHPDAGQIDSVEVSTSIGSALKFLSSEWKDKVRIEQNIAQHLAIRGNRNKLLQVFVNLLQNSLDAVRRKQFVDEKPAIWIEGRVEGGKTIVTVRDNGEGIDAGAINKVFDPFYTTKDVGEGMGLGLTICYRIVQECEGRISVQSERGKYCEFKLEFPAKQ